MAAPLSHPLGFLLLHGGGMGPWVWDKVTPKLAFPACAAERIPPGKDSDDVTINDCAKFALAQADAAQFDHLVVVCHSITGIVAPQIAILAPHRVKQLVFIAANIPEEGKTSLSVFPPALRVQMEIGARLVKWGMASNAAIEDWMQEHLCNDLNDEDKRRLLRDGKNTEPFSFFSESISRKSMPVVPCTYIKLEKDLCLLPDAQEHLAANIKARVLGLNAGHMAMLSRPDDLAAILNNLAKN